MEKPPFQFRLLTIFLFTFVVAVLCAVVPVLYRGIDWFRQFKDCWWLFLIPGAVLVYHIFLVLVAYRRLRDSDS